MLVSACIIVYNHENFIKECLEGGIKQHVDFDYEIIVSDDCSTDKSFKICNEYALKYPRLIKYERQVKNLGMHGNWMKAISKCKGKYIAICEGDDFWTDPFKLQKQVDFLESNPEYEVCFTNTKIINNQGDVVKEKLMNEGRKETYCLEDLPIWAPTLTRVFRNRDFKGKIPKAPGLDTVMLLYQSNFGKLKLLNEVTATYRLHDGGIYSNINLAKKKEHVILTDIVSLSLINKSLFPKYFGMLLKKLVELKALDIELYKKSKKLIYNNYKKYYRNFTFLEHSKVWFSFILVSVPFFQYFTLVNKVFLKILNRLFIYK